MYTKINAACDYIRGKFPGKIDTAIILGSGLGPLANEIESPTVIDYRDIPHFPAPSLVGHEGKLIIGKIGEKTVCAMKGRFHYYEGHDMDTVTLPVRVFARLGIGKLILTNAAGGIRQDFEPGTIVLIRDHLSLLCPSPLRGPNMDEFGPRFKDMTEVYSTAAGEIAHAVAAEHGIALPEGVYAFFRGPQFETPAEIRAIKALGADLAGMSTVPEAIVARHSGIETLGLSLVTNKAAGLSTQELSHEEVMETAAIAEKNLVALVRGIIEKW